MKRALLLSILVTTGAGAVTAATLGATCIAPGWLIAVGVGLALLGARVLQVMWRVEALGATMFTVGAVFVGAASGGLWQADYDQTLARFHAEDTTDPRDWQWTERMPGDGDWLDDEFDDHSNEYVYSTIRARADRLSGTIEGRIDAKADLARGLLRIEIYGLRSGSEDDHEQYMLDTYGIEYVEVAGCLISDRILAHADAYNEIMRAAIIEKFGKDVFEPSLR